MIPTDYLRRHIAKGGQLSEARWEFLKEKKGLKKKKYARNHANNQEKMPQYLKIYIRL